MRYLTAFHIYDSVGVMYMQIERHGIIDRLFQDMSALLSNVPRQYHPPYVHLEEYP